VAAIFAATIVAPSSGAAAPLRAAPDDGEWLFVQQAKRATLRELPGSGRLRLTLIRPSPTVSAFTDRPTRRFDVQPLSTFVAKWSAHFGRVPPNAAIEVPGASSQHDVLIVELGRPQLDRRGRLSYRVRPLHNAKRTSDLRFFQRRADARLPVRLGRISLFIDDADDSVAQLAISFQADTWLGVFVVSSVSLSTVYARAPGSVLFSGNQVGFMLQTLDGAQGGVFLEVNPLGNCVLVTVENAQGTAQSLTANVGTNPAVPLSSGTNEVPVSSQPC